MQAKLTMSDKKFLSDFLKQEQKFNFIYNFPLLYSGILSLSGLILLISAVVITLNYLTDHSVLWILLPGTAGGILAILGGVFLYHFLNKLKDEQKLVNIIKKIINGF